MQPFSQVNMDGAHARPATTLHKMAALLGLIQVLQPWFTACIFDIEHSCYGQFTPVKTSYPLQGHVTISRGQV